MDREYRTRWTDDRLNDLATLVRANDKRLDDVEHQADKNTLDINKIAETGDRRAANFFSIKLAVLTVVLGQIGTIVTLIVTVAHR